MNSYPMIVEMSKGCEIGKFTGTYYTFSVAAFWMMSKVRHGDSKPLKKKDVLEHFDVDD